MANKFDLLESTIVQSSPDVVVITETWVKYEQLDAFNINGYNVFHLPRRRVDKSHGGGIAIYTKSQLTIMEYRIPDDINIEAITMIFKPKYLPRSVPWIAVLAVYIPPCDVNRMDISDHITSEIDRLLTKNNNANIYILGDFNQAKNESIMGFTKFKQIIKKPTRGVNIIDKCYTNIDFPNDISYLPPIGDSDHVTIVISPQQHQQIKNNKITRLVRRKDASSYRTMGNTLSEINWNIWLQIDDVHFASSIFHEFLCQLYEICFPYKSITYNRNDVPWINTKIKDLIKYRNVLYKSSNEMEIKSINMEIRKMISIEKNKFINSYDGIIDTSSHKFYNKIKILTGSRAKTRKIVFPNKTEQESNELMVKYFDALANVHHSFKFDSSPGSLNEEPKINITIGEVYQELNKIKVSSPAAPCDVPPYIYREYAMFLAEPIMHIINLSIDSGICPELWKLTYLVPVPKNNIPKDPNDIRPISISSPIAKICENFILRMTLRKVAPFMDCNQFGGVKGRSTTQLLSFFIDYVCTILQNPKFSVCTIISDFSKAFNNVDHEIFFSKFLQMNPPYMIIKWLSSFLYKRTSILVGQDNNVKCQFTAANGIPQGTVTGTFIFAVIVNDIFKNQEGAFKFIDDLTVSAKVEDNNVSCPQELFDELVRQSDLVKLPLNLDKCFSITFDFKKNKKQILVLHNQTILKPITSFKFLGIMIQEDIKWSNQVANMIKKANSKMHIIYAMRRAGMSKLILKKVYITFIRPIMEYAAPVWHSALTQKQTHDIERIQNRAIRIIMNKEYKGIPEALIILSLESLESRRIKIHQRFALSFLECFPNRKPITQGEASGRISRGSNNLKIPIAKTKRMMTSPIYSYWKAYNDQFA